MAKRTCELPGCGNPYLARGLCPKHYSRWRLTGSTELQTAEERFLEKVVKRDFCWLWQGAPTPAG